MYSSSAADSRACISLRASIWVPVALQSHDFRAVSASARARRNCSSAACTRSRQISVSSRRVPVRSREPAPLCTRHDRRNLPSCPCSGQCACRPVGVPAGRGAVHRLRLFPQRARTDTPRGPTASPRLRARGAGNSRSQRTCRFRGIRRGRASGWRHNPRTRAAAPISRGARRRAAAGGAERVRYADPAPGARKRRQAFARSRRDGRSVQSHGSGFAGITNTPRL